MVQTGHELSALDGARLGKGADAMGVALYGGQSDPSAPTLDCRKSGVCMTGAVGSGRPVDTPTSSIFPSLVLQRPLPRRGAREAGGVVTKDPRSGSFFQ